MPATAPHLDPAAEAADAAAAVQAQLAGLATAALEALSARARAAAAVVSTQVAVHQQLVGTDWHGAAAGAFTGVLEQRSAQLLDVQRHLLDIADEAARRARLVSGDAW